MFLFMAVELATTRILKANPRKYTIRGITLRVINDVPTVIVPTVVEKGCILQVWQQLNVQASTNLSKIQVFSKMRLTLID